MAYAFDLRQVCGGYAYFSTFTMGRPSEHDRYEIRKPSSVVIERFRTALQEIGQIARIVDSDESYQDWLLFQGWGLVERNYARANMPQWLKQHYCIRSSHGSFTDIDIASPGVMKRTQRGLVKRKIVERDGSECLICSEKNNLTLQHIWPFSVGGETSSRNLATLCEACNQNLKNEIYIDLYRLAGLHHGFEPSLIKEVSNIEQAIQRAVYFSNNIMHTRCDLW